MFSDLRKLLRRLSIRLTLWHALLFLSAGLTVLSLSYVLIKERLDFQERDFIDSRLRQYRSEYERGGINAVRTLAALRTGRQQKAFFVRLANSQNRTLFLRDAEDWAEFSPERLEGNTLEIQQVRDWLNLYSPSGTNLLLKSVLLSDGLILQVGKSTEGLQELLTGFRVATFFVLLVFLPTSIAGGAFLASRALRPVQLLTAAAERIVATASFEERVPSGGTGDELDALVEVFNKMLSRLDRLVRGMRDSLDNVAHDLRTPMTRLRQHAQLALETEAPIDATRDALADCVEEAESVMTLLNTLMDIAETESGLVEFQRLPVEVDGLIRSTIDSYAEVAEEKGVAVTNEATRGLRIKGDGGALRRVFANLLDNAVKYTPPGGRIRIRAEVVGESVAIHFIDSGVGIPAEDLPRIWDRLFRGDRSRSEHGLGLGLSFVRAIVESHGGKATVASEAARGTDACIVLPAYNSTPGA